MSNDDEGKDIFKFPNVVFRSISDFKDSYIQSYFQAISDVSNEMLENASTILEETYRLGNTVFVCGNGGSAAVANHMVCDHGKLIANDTDLRANVRSLCSSSELMTAISNDLCFSEIFAHQLNAAAKAGDVLVIFSASGESPNIIKALIAAKDMNMHTVAFTGFSGGRAAKIADVNIHVSSQNYGIVEDAHQAMMQMIAQFIRMKNMRMDLIEKRYF